LKIVPWKATSVIPGTHRKTERKSMKSSLIVFGLKMSRAQFHLNMARAPKNLEIVITILQAQTTKASQHMKDFGALSLSY
jgi:hypothetical protein